MKHQSSVVFFAVGFLLIASPVLAETIRPDEAPRHLGQVVTVEGVVSEVHHAASGRATFIDIGGRYPNNPFTAVIFSDDANKFPDVDALNGKTVDITGIIKNYKDRPEIILNDASQVKVK
jgi:DNA/RNA endonuclease YhcR with UshA esterase domain